jgi:hypothetical protein
MSVVKANRERSRSMSTAIARFHDLDDLVLNLKGLVLVRDLRKRADADRNELAMYDEEIARVRDRLAELVRNGCRVLTAPDRMPTAA